ncbi:hypothetical protein HXY32_00325 [Candidatus Bathyarchaeota archaeon]|nr:hypothetical protein [Candidatus Bathyarchaeota archaeon]
MSRKRLAIISIIIAILIMLGWRIAILFPQSEVPFSMKATIIDQLAGEFPNFAFIQNVTGILENRGFNVTYYNGTLDVSFFRNLAKNNYGIIILRVHSALRYDNSSIDFFTNEEFVYSKYPQEVDAGLLTNGTLFYGPKKYYFAISPDFIRNLEGRFPKSIIVAMGCSSLKPGLEETMARAFLDKDAMAYVGWADLVLPKDTDSETSQLLKMFVSENSTLWNAVKMTRRIQYSGVLSPYNITSTINFDSWLRLYPSSAANLTISELISEAKTFSTMAMSIEVEAFLFFLATNTVKEAERFHIEKAALVVNSL